MARSWMYLGRSQCGRVDKGQPQLMQKRPEGTNIRWPASLVEGPVSGGMSYTTTFVSPALPF